MKYFKLTLVSTLILTFSLATYAATKHEMGIIINLSGKQRMLTQKITKEILLIANGIDVKANLANVKKSAALFDKTLKGLLNGDKELGLVKTESVLIIQQLHVVNRLWQLFYYNVNKVLENRDTSKAVLQKIARLNMPLLRHMNKAVNMYEKRSGYTTLAPKMAEIINKAGRQRMLTQKMTKEFLLLAKRFAVKWHKVKLAKTVALFDETLNWLIRNTSERAILVQLNVVKNLWGEYKPILDQVNVSREALQKAARLNLPLLIQMNKAVEMYTASAK
ncbi:hypothetical protein PN36_29790 [Candidatus Thiomargarita nelsonii]|uniref:NarX-like N-terminal domain-containing protein n=1 Tax=Candidatus Thiomargarita nelsonii TaxID=1003181 RepID=A0A4E0QPF1_9GAMM|nr:hypothetical protein PN36_29790 [Candidatus Thiomargarita nelsonii]